MAGSHGPDPVADGLFRPRTVRRRIITAILLFSDITAILAAGLIASLARFGALDAALVTPGSAPDTSYLWLSVVIALMWPIIFAGSKLYDPERLFWGSGEFRRAVRAVSMGVFAVIAVNYVFKLPGISREWLAATWVLATVLVCTGRALCRKLIRAMRIRGRLQRPALILGTNSEALRLVQVIRQDAGLGIRPVACLRRTRYDDDPQEALLLPGLPIIGTSGQLCEKLESSGADVVVFASSDFSHEKMSEMLSELRSMSVDVYVSAGLYGVLSNRVIIREFNGVPIIAVRGISLSPGKMRIKRAFEFANALAVMVFGLPFWLLVAAVIKLDSPGPVLFTQERIGLGGVPFQMYKYRSMHADAEQRLVELAEANEASGPLFKMKEDPRITRSGAWLRRYSIDEFPQLLNVIKGEMSIVGPRPPLPSEVEHYHERHLRRLEARPGMTGLWQVSGRSDLSFDEMVRLDIYYIENWSLGLDIAIMLRTLPAVFSSRGAY